MTQSARNLAAACLLLAPALLAPSLLAQSSPSQQNDQQSRQQNQPASQPASQDQTTGVSNPPPDSSIEANEVVPPPAPEAPAKPSAAIPAQPAPTPGSASAAAPVPPTNPAPAAAPQGSGSLDNTDYGIVTVVPAAQSAGDPSLQQRGAWNPNDHIVSSVPIDPNQLGAGTNITVSLSQAISTSDTQEGAPFRATVKYDVYNGATLVIPAGSEMRGRVTRVTQGHHIGLHASLRLRPEVILLPDGTAYHLDAQAVQSRASGTRTTDEGNIVATAHVTKDAIEYGAGAGAGAIVGAEVAGPVGAGVGSLVGAGLTTTHLLMQQPQAASLPQGTILIFGLTEPMTLTPTKN